MLLVKSAAATSLMLMALGSSMAFAEGEARHSINVVASVPTSTFLVIPVRPELITEDQRLSYNPVSGDLSTLREQFDTKHTAVSIKAMLESEAFLSNGVVADKIPLTVTFNGQALNDATAVEVVSLAEAAPGKRVELVIAPTKPGAPGYAPGEYSGVVAMRFDAVVPVPNP